MVKVFYPSKLSGSQKIIYCQYPSETGPSWQEMWTNFFLRDYHPVAPISLDKFESQIQDLFKNN